MLLPERRQWRRLFVLRTRKGHEVSWGYNNWIVLVNLSIYSRTKWDEQDKMVRFNDHKDFVDFDISRPNNKPSRFWTEVEILGKWSRTEKNCDHRCKPYPKSCETRQIRSLGKQECTNKKGNANVRREGKRKFEENKRRKWRKESVLWRAVRTWLRMRNGSEGRDVII